MDPYSTCAEAGGAAVSAIASPMVQVARTGPQRNGRPKLNTHRKETLGTRIEPPNLDEVAEQPRNQGSPARARELRLPMSCPTERRQNKSTTRKSKTKESSFEKVCSVHRRPLTE